jgi:hypothetical protein
VRVSALIKDPYFGVGNSGFCYCCNNPGTGYALATHLEESDYHLGKHLEDNFYEKLSVLVKRFNAGKGIQAPLFPFLGHKSMIAQHL